jgi:hypothetical protein
MERETNSSKRSRVGSKVMGIHCQEPGAVHYMPERVAGES